MVTGSLPRLARAGPKINAAAARPSSTAPTTSAALGCEVQSSPAAWAAKWASDCSRTATLRPATVAGRPVQSRFSAAGM